MIKIIDFNQLVTAASFVFDFKSVCLIDFIQMLYNSLKWHSTSLPKIDNVIGQSKAAETRHPVL